MTNKAILAAAGAALLAGCTSALDVQVDVMNPAYSQAAVTEASYLTELNMLAQGRHARAEALLADGVNQLKAFRSQCITLVIADLEVKKGAAAAAEKPNLDRNIVTLGDMLSDDPDTGDFENLWRAILYQADEDARTALGGDLARYVGLSGFSAGEDDTGDVWNTPLPQSVKQKLAERDIVFDSFVAAVRAEIDRRQLQCLDGSALGFPPPSLQTLASTEQAAEQAKQKVETAKLTSVVGGGMLLNELTEAYFVTNAPEDAWAEYYNRAVSRGAYGNMSVAVKMNDTADFSIKGMVFDGRSTAELMSKLGVQSVAAIARAYGAPISMSGTGSSSQVQFEANQSSSANRRTIASAEAQEEAYRASLFQIADTVLANFGDLRSGQDTAREITGTVIRAQTARWATQTGGSGAGDGDGNGGNGNGGGNGGGGQ